METLQDIWGDLGVRLRRFVGSRVNDPHAADDITQDVMLKVQTQLDAMPPEDKLPAWVFAVARNAVVDHHRARAVRGHADIDDVEQVADDAGAEQQAAFRELAPCLVRMVEHLPEPYREAIKLADFEGLSQQEVADRAGISLSGAKSRVQRARQRLRELILDCCDIERDARGNVVDYDRTERSSRYCDDDDGTPQCGRWPPHEQGDRMPVIACNLDAVGLKGRQHVLAGLVARAAERRELRTGYAFGFAPGTVGLVEVAEVVEPERRCCPFLRFVVSAEAEAGPLWLEVTGPDTAKEFLQGLLHLT